MILPIDEVALGEKLFFETQLSRDNTISCGSCHQPSLAFSDSVTFSKGVRNQLTSRNTPTIMNLIGHEPFFWDGRALTLEEQALGPIESRVEMDMPISEIANRLNAIPFYRQAFFTIYGERPFPESILKAIVAYESKLETSDTPFDQYMQGDTLAISAAAKRGQQIFNTKGRCFDCHFGPDFTGDDIKSIGLFDGKEWNDSGRYLITRDLRDLGKFKTPGLRNIAITAPYMHNGKLKTLEAVIDYYNNPDQLVPHHQNRDTVLKRPLGLSNSEKSDLLAYLNTLTDRQFIVKP
jgi:cytochrome c peroxidase